MKEQRSEKRYWGRIHKVSHLEEVALAKPRQDIQPGFFEEGNFSELPRVGENFVMRSDRRLLDGLITTQVQSVMEVDSASGWDKVVLPPDFPRPETLSMLFGEPARGDVLFATRNSLYWLHDIQEEPIPKSQSL